MVKEKAHHKRATRLWQNCVALPAWCRTYELLKQQQEEEQARREEEEALLDLLRAELEAERARRAADERRRRQEQMKREMIQANEYQKQLKVGPAGQEARVLSRWM